MIRVDVEPYCDGCLEFVPDVTYPEKYCLDERMIMLTSDTVITCENRKRCKNLVKHLEKKLKEGENEHGT